MLLHKPGYFSTGLSSLNKAESMLVDQSDIFPVFNDYAKAVETADISFNGFARHEKHLHFYACFSNLIKKLILNIEMSLRHFRTPVHSSPGNGRSSRSGGKIPAIRLCAEKICNHTSDPLDFSRIKPQDIGFGTKPSKLPLCKMSGIPLQQVRCRFEIYFSG